MDGYESVERTERCLERVDLDLERAGATRGAGCAERGTFCAMKLLSSLLALKSIRGDGRLRTGRRPS